jgi:hypothetical protein
VCRQSCRRLTQVQGKKRKIHGSSSQTDISIYSSMSTPTGTERIVQGNPCQLHIGERLGKLEQLFERFVCRKNSAVEPPETPRSPTLMDSSDTQSKLSLPTFSSDAQSVSSIGDGIVSLSRCDICSQPNRKTAWGSDLEVCTKYTCSANQAGEYPHLGLRFGPPVSCRFVAFAARRRYHL